MAEARRIGTHYWNKETETLTVWIDGVKHIYSNVSYYWGVEKLEASLRNFGRAMAILRKLHEVKGE